MDKKGGRKSSSSIKSSSSKSSDKSSTKTNVSKTPPPKPGQIKTNVVKDVKKVDARSQHTEVPGSSKQKLTPEVTTKVSHSVQADEISAKEVTKVARLLPKSSDEEVTKFSKTVQVHDSAKEASEARAAAKEKKNKKVTIQPTMSDVSTGINFPPGTALPGRYSLTTTTTREADRSKTVKTVVTDPEGNEVELQEIHPDNLPSREYCCIQ